MYLMYMSPTLAGQGVSTPLCPGCPGHCRDVESHMPGPASDHPWTDPLATETMQLTWDHDKDLWEFVDFEELFVYLRGSKNLRIPDGWKDIIPRRIPK